MLEERWVAIQMDRSIEDGTYVSFRYGSECCSQLALG
jgi:hypothetical protein